MIEQWVRAGVFSAAERHGAEVLCRADSSGDELVPVAAALALWAPLHGHSVVDLRAVQSMVLHGIAEPFGSNIVPEDATQRIAALQWPTTAQWLHALARTPVCRTVTATDLDSGNEPMLDDRPLVLRGTLLSTQRQWVDECIVADDLRSRSTTADGPVVLHPSTIDLLAQLLPGPSRQHDAAVQALISRLAVIVGGPGTGKTHTIARVLMALRHQAVCDETPVRIALAAPTGKAAARMAAAMAAADPDGVLTDMRPTTIHRLLGSRGQRTRFVHGPDRPLAAEVVVIDEASMVALPLMARLIEALRPEARLILVGDPDQLESIEVGAVLADVVSAAGMADSPLAACVTRLDRTHRQTADSPIGPLADAIRLDRPDDVMALLRASDPDITFVDIGPFGLVGAEQAVRDVALPTLRIAHSAAIAGDADAALAALGELRVLCAHRTGPFGVQRWNRTIEAWVRGDATTSGSGQIAGRPLLATRNDPRLRIANGDTAIIVDTPSGPRAAFATVEGIRLLAPAQLDAVETAYAMTIHKSQGSEYSTVVVVLPPATSPLIGRELLYTAITRATRRVVVVGDELAVRACVQTPGRRVTGLAQALSRPSR